MLTYTEFNNLNESQKIKYDLYKKYDEFNKLYFQNSLPKNKLEWEDYSDDYHGMTHLLKGTRTPKDMPGIIGTEKIVIHKNKEIREEYLEEYYDAVLLHEMIHVELSYMWYDLSSSETDHGKIFRSKLKPIIEKSKNIFFDSKSPARIIYPDYTLK